MTVVSLAKAGKIRNLLQQDVLPQLSTAVVEAQMLTVTNAESDVETHNNYAAAVSRFNVAVETYLAAVEALFKLRRLIDQANHDTGINDVMADINKIGTVKDLWKRLHKPAMFDSYEPLETVLRGVAKRPADNYYSTRIKIKDPKDFALNVSTCELEIRQLEEERNRRNYTATVTLDDELAAVLSTLRVL